jgi:hypothetical protein
MNSGEEHKQRRSLAALVGALVAIFLVSIAAVTMRSQIVGNHDSYFRGDDVLSWVFWIFLGTLSAIPGAAMGIAGGARRFTFRATAAGAAIFALLAGVAPLMLGSAAEAAETRHEAIEQTWMFAVVFAFFSLTSCAGAVVTGKKSDDGRTRMQFTLAEILLAFIPFAVFMGFLAHFPKK